jgi:hypothetical protein
VDAINKKNAVWYEKNPAAGFATTNAQRELLDEDASGRFREGREARQLRAAPTSARRTPSGYAKPDRPGPESRRAGRAMRPAPGDCSAKPLLP